MITLDAVTDTPDETIERVSWLLIRDYRVLFVRTYTGDVFFDPGCRRLETTGNHELDRARDIESLTVKMRHDLGIELVADTFEKMFSFSAPAYGKEEHEVMVRIRCYTCDFLGHIQELCPSKHIKEVAWFINGDSRPTSDAGRAILLQLASEGLIYTAKPAHY